MDRLGADTAGLLDASGALADTAITLDRTRAHLRTRLTVASWTGADRDAFLADWGAHDASMSAAASMLRQASRSLRDQAGEQDRASGAVGPSVTAAATALGARGPADAAVPRRVDAWEARAGFAAGVGLAATGALVTEDLPGPTSTVTVANHSAVMGEVAVGSFAELWGESFGAGSGREATAAASAGLRVERTWIVSDPDAARFGRDRVADTALVAATTGPVLGPLGNLVDSARRLVGAEPPAPAITTSLVTAGVGLTASAAGGPFGGRVAGTSTIELGVRERDSGTSAVVRWDAEGDIGLTNGLLGAFGLPSSWAGAIATEIELLPAAGGHRSILVEVSQSLGSRVEVVHIHAVYREADLRGHLHRAFDAFGAGDPDRAVGELGRAARAVVTVTATTATGSVRTGSRGGAISAAEGIGLSGEAGLDHSVTTLGQPTTAPIDLAG